MSRISIFWKDFWLLKKFRLLSKISISEQNFNWPSNILIFDHNFDFFFWLFRPKIFLTEIFDQDFWPRFLTKILGQDFWSIFLTKIFDQDFWQRFLTKSFDQDFWSKFFTKIFDEDFWPIFWATYLTKIIDRDFWPRL